MYNIAEEKVYTEEEWIQKIAKTVGWKGKILESNDLDTDVDLQQYFYVSSEKIRKELGFYEKYNTDEGLAENIFFSAYLHFEKHYQKDY